MRPAVEPTEGGSEVRRTKVRAAVMAALLAASLAFIAVCNTGAFAAPPKPDDRTQFKSSSALALPVLQEIRDTLKQIDKKLDTLVKLQTESMKQRR